MYRLIGAKACGSMSVEALLTVLGLPFEYVEQSPFEEGGLKDLSTVNPVGQVPVLILPDGQVMSESAAILLYLADRHGDGQWALTPDDPQRPVLLRWMMFLAANIYSTYVLSDKPARFHPDEAQHAIMKECASARRKAMWSIMEAAFKDQPGDVLLGDQPTILDLYTSMISLWQPSRAWFNAACPRLARAAHCIDRLDKIHPIWLRHEAPIG